MARRGKNKRQDCFDDITDEDLRELRGCIELGFGFNEEDAQDLCATLPALELYFAVNRQVSASPRSNVNDSPAVIASPPTVDPDAWKICSPGMYIFCIFYYLCIYVYTCMHMHPRHINISLISNHNTYGMVVCIINHGFNELINTGMS